MINIDSSQSIRILALQVSFGQDICRDPINLRNLVEDITILLYYLLFNDDFWHNACIYLVALSLVINASSSALFSKFLRVWYELLLILIKVTTTKFST